METRAEQKRRLAKQWKSEGRCTNCGSKTRPPEPGRVRCRVCLDTALKITRRKREKDPEAFRRTYNTRKESGLCVSCGVEGKPRTNGLQCAGCSLTERQRSARIKYEVMSKYGGSCVCCGESRTAFLSLDHINNDGAEKRRSGEHVIGTRFYKRLLQQPLDDSLQVLCYNCNLGRRVTGVCPHTDNSFYEATENKPRWARRDFGETLI